jgi:hypothetical protein
MRRAARIDDNQKEIVKAFRKAGAYVLLVHQLKNCCDCIIVYKGKTIAIEIKDGKKPPSARKLTGGEAEFADNWIAAGGHWEKVESLEDVIRLTKSQ